MSIFTPIFTISGCTKTICLKKSRICFYEFFVCLVVVVAAVVVFNKAEMINYELPQCKIALVISWISEGNNRILQVNLLKGHGRPQRLCVASC